MTKRSVPHGTRNGYTNYGCRCRPCKDAHAAYYRESGLNRRVGARAEQKRRADAALRHPCADCPTLVGRQEIRCVPCELRRRQHRREEIQRRWLAGETVREIATALGTTKNAMGSTIVCMRREGWHMPYRRTLEAGGQDPRRERPWAQGAAGGMSSNAFASSLIVPCAPALGAEAPARDTPITVASAAATQAPSWVVASTSGDETACVPLVLPTVLGQRENGLRWTT